LAKSIRRIEHLFARQRILEVALLEQRKSSAERAAGLERESSRLLRTYRPIVAIRVFEIAGGPKSFGYQIHGIGWPPIKATSGGCKQCATERAFCQRFLSVLPNVCKEYRRQDRA
jgi:hypothetical protein